MSTVNPNPTKAQRAYSYAREIQKYWTVSKAVRLKLTPPSVVDYTIVILLKGNVSGWFYAKLQELKVLNSKRFDHED